MSLLNLALYGNEDPKKKKLNLTPQYRTAAELAGASNYVAPASTTVTYQPAPVPQRTIADYAPPPTYWNSSGDLKINYAGGDPYSYDSRRYNGRVIRDMQNEREWDAAKNIGAFGLSVLSDPIALGMSAFDFAKDPSWINTVALGLDAITPGNVGGFLKGIGEIGIGTAAARELGRKTIGRVATNLISPVGYSNKFRDIFKAFNMRGLKSVINDVPLYPIINPDREFPYRMMFGLQPRNIDIYKFPEESPAGKYFNIKGQPIPYNDLTYVEKYPNPIPNGDGTYTIDKNTLAYKALMEPFSKPKAYSNKDFTNSFNVGGLQNPLFGGYSFNWNPQKGNFTAIDDWDFDMHPREFQKDFANAVKYVKEKGDWFSKEPSYFSAFKRVLSNEITTNLLRYAMSKITDPIKYRVPIELNDFSGMTREIYDNVITDSFLDKFNYRSPGFKE